MSVMKRLSSVVQAKANKALDRVEDPRDTLDLSYEKQLEQLQQVRKGVADVATARKRIELQAEQLQANANKLQDQARSALAQNREDLAREALTRRAAIATQLEALVAERWRGLYMRLGIRYSVLMNQRLPDDWTPVWILGEK